MKKVEKKKGDLPIPATKERGLFQSIPSLHTDTINTETEKGEDIIELFSELQDQWQALTKESVGLKKHDYKSISDYQTHDPEKLESLCKKVNSLYENIFLKISEHSVSLTAKLIKDEAVKMFVISLQWTCNTLLELLSCPSGEHRELAAEDEQKAESLLGQRGIHNDLILILMQDRRSQSFLVQHDTIIMQIIRTNIIQFQERLAQHSKPIDLNKTKKFFYFTFQTIAMLAVFQQSKKFMKGAAYDGIRLAFDLLQRCLELSFSSPIFQEIFNTPIQVSDNWIKLDNSPKFCIVKFGKKKMSLVHISNGFSLKESPLFSLRFVNVYYAYKISQILMGMKRFVPADRTLDVITMILTRNTVVLEEIVEKSEREDSRTEKTLSPISKNKTEIEQILNENLICLKIIYSTIVLIDDPLGFMEKFGLNRYLKNLMQMHLIIALKEQMCLFPNSVPDSAQSVSSFSYTKNIDFVANIFKFINNMRMIGSSKDSASKIGKLSLLVFSDELLMEILKYCVSKRDLISPSLSIFKAYLVEYYCGEDCSTSVGLGEKIMQMISSNIFNFTIPIQQEHLGMPRDLPIDPSTELEEQTHTIITNQLNKIIHYDRKWASQIFSYFLGQTKHCLSSEMKLFGIFKLIYSAIVNNGSIDLQILLNDISYKNLNYQEMLNSEKRKETLNDNKAIYGLIDIKAVMQLCSLLIEAGSSPNLSPNSLRLIEKFILLLHHIPVFCDFLLSSPKMLLQLMERGLNTPSKFSLMLLQKLLAVVKYSKHYSSSVFDRDKYAPLNILTFAVDHLSSSPSISALFPYLKVIIEFLLPDEHVPSIQRHQQIIYQNFNSQSLIDCLLKEIESPETPQLFCLQLELMKGLLYLNSIIKENFKEMSGNLSVFEKLLQCNSYFTFEMIERVLQTMLEIVFEIRIDLLKPGRLIIKSPETLFIYFLYLLKIVKYDSKYKEEVSTYIIYVYKVVSGSYANRIVMSQPKYYSIFIKLMKKYYSEVTTLKCLISFYSEIAQVNISGENLKQFIQLISLNKINNSCTRLIVDSLYEMIICSNPAELFSFLGETTSGLGIVSKKALPKGGFGFFGWIRIERPDQTKLIQNTQQTIFKLGTSKDKEIELYIQNKVIHYSIKDLKKKELGNTLIFNGFELEEDRWYFLELYHLNTEAKTVSLWVNNTMVKELLCKPYVASKEYSENTIGCGIQLDYAGKGGEERLTNNFHGEMSALYFVEVSQKTVKSIHNVISKLYPYLRMAYLFPMLAFGEPVYEYCPRIAEAISLKEMQSSQICEKLFLIVNPKFISKWMKEREKIFCAKFGKNLVEITNHVERVYKQTRVLNFCTSREALLNMNIIKALIPVLNQLSEINCDPSTANHIIAQYFNMLESIILLAKNRAYVFLVSDNGIMLMRLMLKKLSRKYGLSEIVFEKVCVILEVLLKHYKGIAEQFIENIFLNLEIWSYSKCEVQDQIITRLQYTIEVNKKILKIDQIMDSLLNSIEICVSKEKDLRKYIKHFSGLVTKILEENVSETLLSKLMSYANIFYIRRLHNYPLQLFYILKILLDLFLRKKALLFREIKESVQKKKESKVLNTIFVIVDYMLFVKENPVGSIYPGLNLELSPSVKSFSESTSVKEDEIYQMGLTEEGARVIDSILAMGVYLLLMFDWSSLNDIENSKSEVELFKKRSASAPKDSSQKGNDVVGFLLRIHGKNIGKVAAQYFISYLFMQEEGRKTEVFGLSSYVSLMAVCCDSPFNLSFGSSPQDQLFPQKYFGPSQDSSPKTEKLLKNTVVFNNILKYFHLNFTSEAKKEIMYDLTTFCSLSFSYMQEIMESRSTLENIFCIAECFENPKLLKLHGEILIQLILIKQQTAWNLLKGSSEYQIGILDMLLNYCLKNHANLGKAKTRMSLFYIQMLNAIEDLITKNPNLLQLPILTKLICKVLLIMNKMDLLYISAPQISLFDQRSILTIEKEKSLKLHWYEYQAKGYPSLMREGGVLRILLKILLFLVKFDESPTATSCFLLQYFLFRDKRVKQVLKNFCEIETQKIPKSKRQKYCLMDIILRKDRAKLQYHASLTEFVIKDVIGNEQTLLDSSVVRKLNLAQSKEVNLFDHDFSLLMLLLCELFQLMHFILFDKTNYQQLQGIDRVLLRQCQPKKNPVLFTKLCQILIDILDYQSQSEYLGSLLKDSLSAVISRHKSSYNLFFLQSGTIQLGTVYTMLDTLNYDKKMRKISYSLRKTSVEEEKISSRFVFNEDYLLFSSSSNTKEEEFPISPTSKKVQEESLTHFQKAFPEFADNLMSIIKLKLADAQAKLIENILKSDIFLDLIQPYMHFLSTHNLSSVDYIISTKLVPKIPSPPIIQTENEEFARFTTEFEERIRNRFCFINVHLEKLERDEFRQEFDFLAGSLYRKLLKELNLEIGVWYDKKQHQISEETYNFAEQIFTQILKRNPLYSKIREANKVFSNTRKEFLTLDPSTDELLRMQRFKKINRIEDTEYLGCNFSYLRYYMLKKILLCRLQPQLKRRNFLYKDFSRLIIKRVFLLANRKMSDFHPSYSPKTSLDGSEMLANPTRYGSVDSSSDAGISVSQPLPETQWTEFLPKKLKIFEAEIITIKGAIYGRIMINSVCLSFKSEPMKRSIRHKSGAPASSIFFKYINKKWKLENIKEVIVKKYNIIRQAIEIYFTNSKTVFLVFFTPTYMQRFLSQLHTAIKKKPKISIHIIDQPEKFFQNCGFKEKWINGQISNFKYLMLLNKYSGRSFNDIHQYPVFPWILKEYESESLNFSLPSIYRDLSLPIASISKEKQQICEEKTPDLKNIFQGKPFEAHYLPGKTVLGYMFRVEPYTTVFKQKEEIESSNQYFLHDIKEEWNTCTLSGKDNQELIPQFFYFPSMLTNSNQYSYGSSMSERKGSMHIDQVILPSWAKNHHHFVQIFAICLENLNVFKHLNKWIDLIFGEKQQNSKSFNFFKEYCDEEAMSKKQELLTEAQIGEIQEFGCNPFKIFKEKHPPFNLPEFIKKYQYSIFDYNFIDERLFALIKIHSYKEPITYIQAYLNKIIVIVNGQKGYKSKESYINAPHEKSINMDKKEIALFPSLKCFEEGSNSLRIDGGCSMVSLDNGAILITCRHFDNCVKIIDYNSGEVISHLFFHKTLVNCICCVDNFLYSASRDGVIVKWDIKDYKSVSIISFNCDHTAPIISMDANIELDIIAVVSFDGTVSLRNISNGKFLRLIKPELKFDNTEYYLFNIKVSSRGYLVLVARCKYLKVNCQDYLIVYSINGELIQIAKTDNRINCILMDEMGYNVLTGGQSGRLCKFDIISLQSTDLLESLDPALPGLEKVLNEILSESVSITSLALSVQESCQQLLIGFNNGQLFSYKFSPRLTGSRIFDTLQGLM